MSSNIPPVPWFNSINYNPQFFSTGSGAGITLAYANANYLRISSGSNPISSSATTTFSGSVNTIGNALFNTGGIISYNTSTYNFDFYASTYSAITNSMSFRCINGAGVVLTALTLNGNVGGSSFSGNAYSSTYVANTGTTANAVNHIPFYPSPASSTGQPLYTDSASHLTYNPSTNALVVGGGTNGSISVTGTTSTLSVAGTGTAISTPNANSVTFGTASLTSGNMTMNGTQIAGTNTSLTILTPLTTGGPIAIFPQSLSTNQLTCGTTGTLQYGGNTVNFSTAALNVGAITTSGATLNMTTNTGTAYISATGTNAAITLLTPVGSPGIFFYPSGVGAMSVSSTQISNNVNLTLPTSGVAPVGGQLGYSTAIQTFTATALASGTVRVLATFTSIPAGVYLLTGNSVYTCSTSGTVTQFGTGFSTSSITFGSGQIGISNNINISTQTVVAGAISNYFNSSTVLNLTTATTFYFITAWAQGATSAFSVGGNAQITRIG